MHYFIHSIACCMHMYTSLISFLFIMLYTMSLSKFFPFYRMSCHVYHLGLLACQLDQSSVSLSNFTNRLYSTPTSTPRKQTIHDTQLVVFWFLDLNSLRNLSSWRLVNSDPKQTALHKAAYYSFRNYKYIRLLWLCGSQIIVLYKCLFKKYVVSFSYFLWVFEIAHFHTNRRELLVTLCLTALPFSGE